jgi:hypothetical protein
LKLLKVRLWLALWLLAGATFALPAESIRVVEIRTIDARQRVPLPNGTHYLKLYAHTFQGTQWKSDDVVDAVLGSARLLAQCGITVTAVELRVVEAPARFQYYQTAVSRELLRRMDTPKPAVFFVEDTRNNPAFDAEAVGFANAVRRPELVNTVWVAHGARDVPYALAHELVHVLSDSGEHTDELGNLMRAETAPENARLNPAQCERMRARGEANGLLRVQSR